MNKQFSDGVFAIGLIAGISLTIILTLFVSSGYEETTQLAYAVDRTGTEAFQCGESNKPVWGPWFGLCFGIYDTIAQWLMMAFTVVATALLFGTLIQANRTNRYAIQAANAANEANAIMRNEQRPWVTFIREIECEAIDIGHALHLSWNYELSNKGKTPAYDVHVDWHPVKRNHYQFLANECKEYANYCLKKRQRGHTPVIFPGESTEFRKYVWGGVSRYGYVQEKSSSSDDQNIFVFICVTYRLSNNSQEFGVETIVVNFEESKRWLRPFSTKMLEYSNARYIR